MTELENMLWLVGYLAVFFGPTIALTFASGPKGSETRSTAAEQNTGGDYVSAGSFANITATSTTDCDMHHSC